MVCAGDVPTNETLAAVTMLRERFPDLKIRFINVVDLRRRQARDRSMDVAMRTSCLA
jgi:xylulose-5-phosphate/fructose-6-phosphate phosphoketolase